MGNPRMIYVKWTMINNFYLRQNLISMECIPSNSSVHKEIRIQVVESGDDSSIN